MTGVCGVSDTKRNTILLAMFYNKINFRNEMEISVSFNSKDQGCRDENSKVIFLFDSGEIDTINTIDKKLKCNTGSIDIPLDSEFLLKIKSTTLRKIRLQFTDVQYDFIIDELGQNRLRERIDCVSLVN